MMQQQIESQIQHVLVEFQIGDMKKSMSSAKANFLVAIGLMIATEYLGGLKTGTLGRHRWSKRKKKPQQSLAEFRFEGGFKYLGKPYAKLLKAHKNEVSDIYKKHKMWPCSRVFT